METNTTTLPQPPDAPGAQPTTPAGPTVILIAPNVSEQMGGEAIKALQIYLELERQGLDVRQITHARTRPELEKKFPNIRAHYIEDDALQRLMWASVVLRPLLKLSFQWKSAKVAKRLLKQYPGAVLHWTSPVSPVLPAFRVKGAKVVIGPLNGNIFYPPGFQDREDLKDRLRRVCHPMLQLGHRLLFRGKQTADVLLVAGGKRTYESLRMAGCRDAQFVDSIDSGVEPRLFAAPRITHEGQNFRFVHNGRLVNHKGADLVIKSLPKARNRVTLDVIGRGPEKPRLEALVEQLGLKDRVTFIPWIEDHSKVADVLRQYRAFVFPSLAEANGIVVQEAMVMGLPVVCLDWGGPALLVAPETGFAIKPVSEDQVTTEIAKAMDALGEDPALAERMSRAGRERAVRDGYLWPDIGRKWIGMYQGLACIRAWRRSAPAAAEPNRTPPPRT